jgi:hypothetical protein
VPVSDIVSNNFDFKLLYSLNKEDYLLRSQYLTPNQKPCVTVIQKEGTCRERECNSMLIENSMLLEIKIEQDDIILQKN